MSAGWKTVKPYLRGRLNSREWTEARRIGELLANLKDLTDFIDRQPRRPSGWLDAPVDSAKSTAPTPNE